jgi:hypothetical protein
MASFRGAYSLRIDGDDEIGLRSHDVGSER